MEEKIAIYIFNLYLLPTYNSKETFYLIFIPEETLWYIITHSKIG